jgi:hypothetical protein
MHTCFVVMGFGTKTDFRQNKPFDLNKTYRYIIKPAMEAAGFTCERADEIQHAGVIDVPMYERLLEADVVVADLSTSNLNAMYELGVRHALRPFTTIVIAEEGFQNPFDTNHLLIRPYRHMGEGIDFGEVERMRGELTTAAKEIVASGKIDSPVYTYLKPLTPPLRELRQAAEKEAEQRTETAIATAGSKDEKEALQKPYAEMMRMALEAKARNDFTAARHMLSGVLAVQGNRPDDFVVQQLALVTYKSKDLDPHLRLIQAHEIMGRLSPESSGDPETLGLWGAIHKRLSEEGSVSEVQRRDALERAIWAHEKGFYLKNDYYNGINYAFLLDRRATLESGDERIADRVLARRVRQRVLGICDELLAKGFGHLEEEDRGEAEYWVRATRVEALFGQDRRNEADQAFAEAKAMQPPPKPWMIDSTTEQLGKLEAMLKEA